MRFIKRIVLFALLVAAPLVVAPPAVSFAAGSSNFEACEAVKAINPSGACNPDAPNRLSKQIKVVLQLLSLVAGVIAVIMLIVGGLKYITSQGDSAGVASARNTIIYSLVGLVIVVFAQIIVKFVLSKAT